MVYLIRGKYRDSDCGDSIFNPPVPLGTDADAAGAEGSREKGSVAGARTIQPLLPGELHHARRARVPGKLGNDLAKLPLRGPR